MQGHQHGRAHRLEAELLLAPPLQADPAARDVACHQGCIERGIVGTVVAVAAGTLQVLTGYGLEGQAEHGREVLAQRMHALAVRAHREMAVAELGQRTGRRHRGMGDVGPRDGDLHALAGRGGGRGPRADAPIVAGLVLQPGGFLLCRHDVAQMIPARLRRRRDGSRLRDALDRADEGHEVGLAHDLQFTFRGTTDRRLVEPDQRGAAIGLAQRARMQHVRGQHVVHIGRARQLGRQVETRRAPADHTVGRRGLHRRLARGRLREVDVARDGPIVLAGRRAVLQEQAIDHREIVGAAIEAQRRALQRLGPHLGADQPHRRARHLNRQRRRRVLLVGTGGGVARQHGDTIERQVEFLGRDLADRRHDALAHLDLAGGDARGAVGQKADPTIQPRIVDQALRQRRRVHAGLASRSTSAARSTARRMR